MNLKKVLYKLIPLTFSVALVLTPALHALADDPPDYDALAEARKGLPIQSNSIADWPQGPEVSAQAAILMEADTGAILYAKNIDERLYPASTTKILTCTLAYENSDLTDIVKFSSEAVKSVPWDGSKIGIDPGEAITMQQAYEAILIGSANEVANGVAEHKQSFRLADSTKPIVNRRLAKDQRLNKYISISAKTQYTTTKMCLE